LSLVEQPADSSPTVSGVSDATGKRAWLLHCCWSLHSWNPESPAVAIV
jgi:hypothetical protein